MTGGRIETGIAERPMPGEIESGDGFLVKPVAGGAMIAVFDGLGHGADAAEATRAARASVAALPWLSRTTPLADILTCCHEELRGTRGVAMAVALVSWADGLIRWSGVGNVEALLVRGGDRPGRRQAALNSRSGVLGFRLPTLAESTQPLADGDALVFATDGVSLNFQRDLELRPGSQEAAEDILMRFAKPTDDALVLVAKFFGASA